jgi:hypothetical protein
MNTNKPTEIASMLMLLGANKDQATVRNAENTLACALEVHGTSIAEPLDGGLLTVCDFSCRGDVVCFAASQNIGRSEAAKLWLISAVSDIAESINSDTFETVICTTQSGRNHLIKCMRELCEAVDKLPADEISYP